MPVQRQRDLSLGEAALAIGVSVDTLLEQVWDDPGESLDRTVDAHVKTLRAKLKAIAPALEPIRTHRGAGYALAEDLPLSLP